MVQFLIDWDNFDYFVGRWGLLIELISRSILILNSVVTVFRIFKCLWEFLWSLWCLLCIWKQRVGIKFKFFFWGIWRFLCKKILWASFCNLMRIFHGFSENFLKEQYVISLVSIFYIFGWFKLCFGLEFGGFCHEFSVWILSSSYFFVMLWTLLSVVIFIQEYLVYPWDIFWICWNLKNLVRFSFDLCYNF